MLKSVTFSICTEVKCSKVDPIIDSHHDIIFSHITLPFIGLENHNSNEHLEAPRIENDRTKILWSEDGILEYQMLVSPVLSSLRENWSDVSSPSSLSVLLQTTNEILSTAAKSTNKHINLGETPKTKSSHIPREVKLAAKIQDKAHKHWLHVSEEPNSSDKEKADAKEESLCEPIAKG